MRVMVHYKNNVVMNYTLCAHCPYEGFRICFNGTKGRLEYYFIESGILEKVGDWIKVYGESVRGVSKIKMKGGSFGGASQKGNKVYLYIHYPNDEGVITIPDCAEPFKSARMLGSDKELTLEYLPGKLLIHGTPKFELNTIPVVCLKR